MARTAPVLVSEFPRQGDGGVSEELPAGGINGDSSNDLAKRPRQGSATVWKDREGYVHNGLPVPAVSVPGVRDLFEQLRHEVGV